MHWFAARFRDTKAATVDRPTVTSAIQFIKCQNLDPTVGLKVWVKGQTKFLRERTNQARLKRRVLFLTSRATPERATKKKAKAGQTSIDTHPARAPKGKTSRKPGYRSSPLSIQAQPRGPATAAFAGRARVKKGAHCRAPRIWFINPGGICGSFREHKRGRIL